MTATLFTPFDLGPLRLPNRVVMAPCTRNRSPACVPTDINGKYYAQRADAGLIIAEASQVSPHGIGYPDTPGCHRPDQIEAWQRVVEDVHREGGRIYLQLWHVGRISHPDLQPNGEQPVAPSAVRADGYAVTYDGLQPHVTPRALETDEIPGIVELYRHAAACARMAGFDGVEVHAANGYLLDQFLRDGTNQRTDAYGGSIDNRMRLLLEVTEAVAGAMGRERTGVRLSPENPFNDMADSTPEETFTRVVAALNDVAPVYLHMVEGRIAEGDPPECRITYSRLRNAFQGAYMANGGYTREKAMAAVEEGYADLVSFGRWYIANPDLATRLERNAPLNTPDESTFYGGDETGYTDYPFLDEL